MVVRTVHCIQQRIGELKRVTQNEEEVFLVTVNKLFETSFKYSVRQEIEDQREACHYELQYVCRAAQQAMTSRLWVTEKLEGRHEVLGRIERIPT